MSTSLTNTSNYMSDSASTIVGTIFRRFSDAIVTETWQYQLRSSKGRQMYSPERLSTLLCTLAKKNLHHVSELKNYDYLQNCAGQRAFRPTAHA